MEIGEATIIILVAIWVNGEFQDLWAKTIIIVGLILITARYGLGG